MSARASIHAMLPVLDTRLDALIAAELHRAADEIDRAENRLVVKKTVVNILRRRANQTEDGEGR